MKEARCFKVVFKDWITSRGTAFEIKIIADDPLDAKTKATAFLLSTPDKDELDQETVEYYKGLVVSDITFVDMIVIDE